MHCRLDIEHTPEDKGVGIFCPLCTGKRVVPFCVACVRLDEGGHHDIMALREQQTNPHEWDEKSKAESGSAQT